MAAQTDAIFLKQYVQFVQHRSFRYPEPVLKSRFHADSKRVLIILAMELGLKSGDYGLRSNKGGIAESGDISLFSSSIQIQILGSWPRAGVQLRFRQSVGQRGKQTAFHVVPIQALLDVKTLVKRMKCVSGVHCCAA